MPSKIVKNGRSRWKGRVQKKGRIRQKLFDTKKDALAWEAEQRGQSWDLELRITTLNDWAEAYLLHTQKFSRKTRNEKRQAFRELFSAQAHSNTCIVPPSLPVTELSPQRVLAALHVQNRKRGGNAANKDRKNLVAAWNWGIRYLGMPEANPCRVEKFPEIRKPRYIPPEEDFWKVYTLTKGQDRLMLLAFLHLGARRNELFSLQWNDVDFGNRRLRLATRKRRDSSLEYDWLPLTNDLLLALSDWKQQKRFEQYTHVFVCGDGDDGVPAAHPYYGKPYKERTQFLKRLCMKAGVKPFGFHAIRHLTASILYRLGQPVSVIQSVLRHKSPTTTTRYLRSLGLEETRSALEDLARHTCCTQKTQPLADENRHCLPNETVSRTVSLTATHLL